MNNHDNHDAIKAHEERLARLEWEIERAKIIEQYAPKAPTLRDKVDRYGIEGTEELLRLERESARQAKADEHRVRIQAEEPTMIETNRRYLVDNLSTHLKHAKSNMESWYNRNEHYWNHGKNAKDEAYKLACDVVKDIFFPEKSEKYANAETMRLIREVEERQAKERKEALDNLKDILGK